MNEPTPFAAPHHLRSDVGTSGSAPVAYGTDDGWLVEFREEPEFMEYLSKQIGSPVFRNRIMTRMIAPGNTKTVWDHPTTGIKYEMAIDEESGEVHTVWEVLEACENGDVPEPVKFAKAWARFTKKTSTALDGWPIEEWGVVSKTYAASLKAQNVHTVQQLAALTDGNAQNIMGALKYRDLAKASLDERAKTRILSKEQERAAHAEEELALVRKQVEELKAIVVRLQEERGQGGAPTLPGRTASDHTAIAPQLRKLSVEQAKKKRGGPPKATPAAPETEAAA